MLECDVGLNMRFKKYIFLNSKQMQRNTLLFGGEKQSKILYWQLS